MQVGHLGLNFSRPSTLQRALASTSGAQVYARLDNLYGTAGLYYSEAAIKTLPDVLVDPRNTPFTVTNADGSLTTVGSGEVSRGTRGLEVYGAATPLWVNTDDPTGWSGSGTVSAALALAALGRFSGYRIASTGQSYHRRTTPALALTAGDEIFCAIYFQVGTSGRLRVQFDGNGTDTRVTGTAGSLSATTQSAGTVTNLSEVVVSGDVRKLTFVFTAATTDDYVFGFGPDSAVVGEDVVFLGATAYSGDKDLGYVPSGATIETRAASEPTLVQGTGPVPYPGYSGTEHTVKIVWDANSTTGDRVVCEIRKDANNRIPLHFVSGILRFESFVAGVSEGFVAVAGVDDGGTHSAVLYWDEVSGTLSLDVDGQGLEGPELVTNGGFDTDTNWTKGDGWLIGSGKASCDGTQVALSNLFQTSAAPAIGTVGRLSYTLLDYSVGTIRPYMGGLGAGALRTANGTYSEDIVTASDTSLYFNANINFVGAIDNVSVKATYTRSGLTLPTDLNQVMLGHSGGANQLNGYVLELAAANGNQAWT